MNKNELPEDKITAEEAETILAETFGGDSVLGLYEKKIMKLRNLLEVSKIINSTLDEEKLLQTILYSCQGQFLISSSSIFLLDDFDSEEYIHKVSIGMFEDMHENLVFTKEEPLTKYFEGTFKGENISYVAEHIFSLPGMEYYQDKIDTIGTQLIFPLKGKKAIYGYLLVGGKLDGKKFESDDVANIKVFSELASISVENVKLFEMAIKDRMTKLYNHQYFQNVLYDEIEKAKKDGSELSLIMFDIDHFKMFNDAYGHQQGDVVLKLVANIIKKSIRSSDFAARYGGEEFAVILPDTNYEGAIKVAEKLRDAIYNTEFPGQNEPLYVTISLGICKYDFETIQSKSEFIEYTDQALYVSKECGRNQWNISEFVPPSSEEIPKTSGTNEQGTKAHAQYIRNLRKKQETEKH